MAANSNHPSSQDAALAWFVRMNSGDATQADRDAFAVWIAASPRHRAEYDALGGIWRGLDAVPDPRRAPAASSRRRFVLGGALAAGLAAIALTATLGGWNGDHRTATGERRAVILADGSRVDLDAGSTVAVDFSSDLRRIRLIEGRARFTVAKDAARPFEVICADGAVRALGTVFVVHRRPAEVAVSVQESAVSVSLPAEGNAEAHVRVETGQRVVYGAAGLGGVEAAAGTAETAWERGKLVFEDSPLGDVIADLNRYRRGRIVLWDDKLAGLRVNGIFDVDKPDAALEAIISTLPVRAMGMDGYLTVLRPL